MLEASVVEGELLSLAGTFRGSAVDDHDVGDLLQLDVEGQSIGFDVMKVTVADEVAVALVLLVVQ